MSSSLKINSTYYKILYSVNEYNQLGYVVTSLGLLKTLNGSDEIDEEFHSLKTFGSLKSIKGKQLSRELMMLLRYHYISIHYFDGLKERFYELTELGKAEVNKERKISKNSKNTAKPQYFYKKVN